MPLTDRQRDHFDALLEAELDRLPDSVLVRLEEVPLIVEDEPGAALLAEMGMAPDDELLGLHSGTALTERSVEDHAAIPDQVMLFRGPILRLAQAIAEEEGLALDDALAEQVHVTLLHEIGHHFGLEEDDLEELGYD